MSAKFEIQWTPIQNKFITWGSEIGLYEIVSLRDSNVPSKFFLKLIKISISTIRSYNFVALTLSNTTGANLLATNSTHHYVKCIDIYPKSDRDLLLAIGQGNGRVTLLTFGPTQYDSLSLPGKEFGKHFITNFDCQS